MIKGHKEDFVNLHCHSHFSLLDGYAKPKEMVKRVFELNQPALAITDHGSFSAVVDVKQACEDAGIKFIPGIEFYQAPFGKDVYWRPESGKYEKPYYHLTAWAYNQVGYQNLLKLVEASNKIGFYHKPRVDQFMLEQHNEGIIITSGCMGSITSQSLNPETGVRGSDYRLVNKVFDWALDVFGRDRYYIEIQDHNIAPLRDINLDLSRINKRYGFEYLVTNDSHYAYPDQWEGQADILCISMHCGRTNPSDFVQGYIDHPGYYLASLADMKAKNYGFDIPDSAFSNTIRIANMVEEHIKVGYEDGVKKYRFPIMPEYEDEGYDVSLEDLAWRGLLSVYGDSNVEANDRLAYELNTIKSLGFSSYFLCVYDIKQFCDANKIPMTVRGSAGGSIVLRCLGITDFCPLEYNLIFERFINSDRVSAPDADLDIDPSRRTEVINYIVNKYGEDHAAQVCSFMYIKGRGAIRDATRIMELDYDHGDALAKRIDSHPKVTIGKALDEKSRFYNPDLIQKNIDHQILDVALNVEGRIRGVGIHAGAVMLSDRPLVVDYPMIRPKTTSKAVTKLLVGFNYKTAEEIGGIKLDILGVEAIGILYRAMELINERYGTKYKFENIPTDDPASYNLINSGCLEEIFQLSGHTAKSVTAQLKPKEVRDIMAINALARPGPLQYVQLYVDRMNGVKKVEYKHPDLEPVLSDTQGIIIYQEQAMRVSQIIAGFTGQEADIFRKAISKKEGIEEVLDNFKVGALSRGYDSEFIEDLCDDLKKFGEYCFNASHACAYSLIAVKMAYLKSFYPIEFYAASLTGRIGNDEKLSDIIKEMTKGDIRILPPKLGLSRKDDFVVDDEHESLRYPYGAVKNVGKTCSHLVGMENITDIKYITDSQLKAFKKTGIRALESLALVGAFDHLFEGNRNEAVEAVPFLSKGFYPAIQKKIFDEKDKYSQADFFSIERKLTGLYLSGNPLDEVDVDQPPFSDKVEVYEKMNKVSGLFAGIFKSARLHRDKNGDLMAFVEIEDINYDSMTVIVFASLYNRVSSKLVPGRVLRVMGEVNVQKAKTPEEEAKLIKYGRVNILAKNII